MKVGIEVECVVCHRRKAPHGRSVPYELGLCNHECPGYDKEPLPGCLWPGETEESFPFSICRNATREVCNADL